MLRNTADPQRIGMMVNRWGGADLLFVPWSKRRVDDVSSEPPEPFPRNGNDRTRPPKWLIAPFFNEHFEVHEGQASFDFKLPPPSPSRKPVSRS